MGVSTAVLTLLQKGLSERYDQNHQVELNRMGISIGGSAYSWTYTAYIRWDYVLSNANGSIRDDYWPAGNYSGSASPSNTTEGEDAYENTYLFPYSRSKSGENIPPNPNVNWGSYWIEGSHYFIGTYKSHTGDTVGEGGPVVIRFDRWYYSIKQSFSPPYYYRNTLAIDDVGTSGDQDFNDFVIRADGDCFFNGPLLKTTAVSKTPTTENVTLVGAANEDWAMYDDDDFNFVINKATQITFVTTRSANYCTKILLVRDSSNYKILLSPSSNPTMYTYTGNPGTYRIGIRRSTSSNPSNCVSATYESSTAPRIWVQNNDPHLGSN